MPSDPKDEAPPQDAPTRDPADVDGRIERALAPYKNLVPEEDYAFMREMMVLYAETHPDVGTLVDSLRKRAPVDRSTGLTRPGLDTAPVGAAPEDAAPRLAANAPQKGKPRKGAKRGR